MKRSARRLALVALATAGAAAATPGVASAHDMAHMNMKSVTVRFAAVSGTAPVSCAAPVTGLGTTATTAALLDLRFYVSNVRLVRANRTSVPLTLTKNNAYTLTKGASRVSLVDLENGTGSCVGDRTTHAVIRGWVPKGTYTGITMSVGLPSALNHSDVTTAPAPLDLDAMNWSWQSGRKFSKIEIGDPAGATGTWKSKAFLVHVGSTGCTGDPATGKTTFCARPNRTAIRLSGFDPATQKVAVDLQALVAANDVTVNAGSAPGCMSDVSDPECAGVFAALGIGGGTQSVFKAIAK